ncbi:MAG: lysophospholipid acyltransferase family protein [Ignavibacteriaceae bacterium]|nr:lysophospholipid acyltransferase family protein [Ignavibacteriaceae bacterium]
MQDRIEYILFIGLSRFVRIIGLKLSRRLAYLLAAFFYYIVPIRKSTVKENLRRAFPDFSKSSINKIAFGSYRSFCITLVEILYLPSISREELKSSVTYSEIPLIKRRYNEGNGLIFLGAHYGNWEYIALTVALHLEIPITVIVKSQRNTFVTKWLDAMRVKWGNKIVPLGISIRQVYKELKEKRIVAMVADQRGPSDGIRIDFMGRKASVFAGPALLAMKTGAPIMFGVTIRQPDFSYKAEIEFINIEDLPEEEELKIAELSQRHAAVLEKYIRKFPEQWFWMHKRWKY